MPPLEHSTVTVPAAPRQVFRTASGVGSEGVEVGDVGSDAVGAFVGVCSVGVGAAEVVGAAAVDVADDAVGVAVLGGGLWGLLGGSAAVVATLGDGPAGETVSFVDEGVDSARTSWPAASITCQVTAAATTTVSTHTSTPTTAARPFT
jgi:hypothetical protein